MEVARGEKMKSIEAPHIAENFVSQTPQKASELSVNKGREKLTEIPDKFLILSELFDHMICSIRLLVLRKRSTTFQNIRVQVEILSGRNFKCENLAQIKYVLPEALKIQKVLVHDKKSLCIKPDIQIMLVHDIVENDHEKSVYVALSQLFTSRVKNFHRKHPEVSDIPEAELPEPFSAKTMRIEKDSPNMSLLVPIQKEFPEAEQTMQHVLSSSPSLPLKVVLTNKITEDIISPSPCSKTDVTNCGQLEHCTSDVYTSASKSTPLKVVSESAEIMLETPAQPTPKRSSSCLNKQKSVMNDGNIVGSLTAKRSLFLHLEDEQNETDFGNEGIDHTGSIQDGLLEAESNEDPLKGGNENIDVNDYSTRDSYKICQHDLIEKHQSSTCLSDFVPVINEIFKSVGWRSITKEELVHKIIVNYWDIDENTDVEGQIELLENIVPDWIHKKLSVSGDNLYSISKVPDLSTIKERVSNNLN